MPGIDVAYTNRQSGSGGRGRVVTRGPNHAQGTGRAYGAMRCAAFPREENGGGTITPIVLRAYYAMCGTDPGYAATSRADVRSAFVQQPG
eukprot:3941588-Rhodomonas_salina.3